MTEYTNLLSRIRTARRQALTANNKDEYWDTGMRVLDDPEDIVAEAKIATQGIGENYGVPKNAEVLQTALKRIEAQGLTPAWEVIDNVD